MMAKAKGTGKPKKKALPKQKTGGVQAGKSTGKAKAEPKPKKGPAREPTSKELQYALVTLKRQNVTLKAQLDAVTKTSKAQQKRIASLEGKMETRAKREEMFMSALELKPQSKKGDKGAIGKLGQSVLAADEHILKMGKRMENMLSALKNHREYLIRLNKKVYKVDPMKRIGMELGIMNNTLSIMAISGFNIDKALFGDMRGIRKMMEKEDADIAKVQKRMAGFKRKFDEELEKFDLDSVFKKSEHIPGYR
ncbi:MAG: hypothetical protein R6W91_05830 [Thermoplasmata archaeon]